MSEWQTIESAPKDGTPLIIFDQGQVGFGWYDDGCDGNGLPSADEPGWYWFDQHEMGDANPSHWQPLPAPPKADKGKDQP